MVKLNFLLEVSKIAGTPKKWWTKIQIPPECTVLFEDGEDPAELGVIFAVMSNPFVRLTLGAEWSGYLNFLLENSGVETDTQELRDREETANMIWG